LAIPQPPHWQETTAPENPSTSPLTKRQVLPQRSVEWTGRNEQVIIHARGARAVLQLRDVRLHLGAIFFAIVLGRHLQALLSLHINHQDRIVELRLTFLGVELEEEQVFVSEVYL